MEDVIIVTIDCWRHDDPGYMEGLQSMADTWTSREMIAGSSATNGVFPILFASQYYPDLYDDSGAVVDGTMSLPRVLSEAGYETALFVGSNPYLGTLFGSRLLVG